MLRNWWQKFFPQRARRLQPLRRRPVAPRLEALEDRTVLNAAYGQLPLAFEPNVGQAAGGVNFVAHGSGYGLALTPTAAVLALGKGGDAVGLELVGGNPAAKASGQGLQEGVSNYLVGNDPSGWHTGVANYGGVKYEGVYAGIDLLYYGNQRQLEYDFVLAAGADPSAIRLRFTATNGVSLGPAGDLVLHVPGGDVVEYVPVVYQTAADGSRLPVSGAYVLAADGTASFAVGAYDHSRPLVIDPTLSYSTYLGGAGNDQADAVAVDGAGNAYLAGVTNSINFPTGNPFQSSAAGGGDAFVAKLNAAGTALVYSTYLGGSGYDEAIGLALDGAGNAYVAGVTHSTNFPIANSVQATNGGGDDAFVAKLNATGSVIVYSTYLGGAGDDRANAIAVDAAGNAYVAGLTGSANFPTAGPLQQSRHGTTDAFVAKLSPAGSALVYSTYLGGSGDETAYGIGVDGAGNAYVTGFTGSTNFPTAGPVQASNGGGYDAFVAKLNAAGSALVYSTYLGGTGDDEAHAVAVDAAGNAYVTGFTASANFPTVGPNQATNGGGEDAFVAKLNAAGSALVYSTYLGGSSDDEAYGVAVDGAGNAYVVGWTLSTNFPTFFASQSANGGGTDAFVAKLNAAGTLRSYSTYLGGAGEDFAHAVAVDAAGNAYVAGDTASANFPTASPFQSANAGGRDAFLSKFSTPSGPTAVFVVGPGTPTDGTHFTSLASAILNVASGGTVTVLPGAVADLYPVAVGLAVTIQGDPNVPADILPRYDLILDASGVTLINLNLGNVIVAPGLGAEGVHRCSLVSFTATASVFNFLDQCVVTGSVALTGTAGGFDLVSNCTFSGPAAVLLSLTSDPSATVQNNTFTGTGLGQVGISLTDSDKAVVANNTVALAGGGLSTAALAIANPGGALTRVTVSNNALQTLNGRGLAVRAGNDAQLLITAQGNDFHNNAIGVDYAGAHGTTLGSDFGGGGLFGLGGNNFRSFTATGSATQAAIYLHGVGAGATLKAQKNLFAASVSPGTVVFASSGSIDVGAALSPDRAFVQALFNAILGRTGTMSELDGWVGYLHSAGQSQATVAHAILYSTEGLDRVVIGLYLRFLGRASSMSERAGWVSSLQGGATLESLQAGFIASAEFRAHNDSDYTQGLYRAILGRTGSSSELAGWNGVLQQPNGFQMAANLFAQSAENRQNAAMADYRLYLHRTPFIAERNAFLAANPTSDLLGLAWALLSTADFYNNG